MAADCEIRDSSLDHSVVLEESRIVGVHHLTDSLIGKEVEITGEAGHSAALRLLIGDHSKIELG